MEFIKKHYEKILLGAVLLGLTAALGYLPFKIAKEREELESYRQQILNVSPKELPPVNLARQIAAFQRAQTPITLNFAGEHNLFNPVQWQKRADERLIKVTNTREIGPQALVVTKVTPLYITISFESTNTSGYLIKIEKETEIISRKRTTSRYLSLEKPKADNLTLHEVKNLPGQPLELSLELTETGEKFTIAMGRPFRRVDGYTVDLKYPPENRTWSARREGNTLPFAGDEYTIKSIKEVAPGEYEIVLSAKSTDKKTTIKYKP